MQRKYLLNEIIYNQTVNNPSSPAGCWVRPPFGGVYPAVRRRADVRPYRVINSRARELIRLIVFFDFEGCGQENHYLEDLRTNLIRELTRNGWDDRCEVIIINPELERWVWHPSDETARIIQWTSFDVLKSWLVQEKFWTKDSFKPERPKECFEAALRLKKIPRSSSLYGKIASVSDWQGCSDDEFNRFIDTIQKWFPRE